MVVGSDIFLIKKNHLPFQKSNDILPGPSNVWPIEVCSGISADKLQQASQLDVVLPQLAAVHRAAGQGPIVIGLWENKNSQARLASSAPSSALPERDTQLTLLHSLTSAKLPACPAEQQKEPLRSR